jgi:hypothetical protein
MAEVTGPAPNGIFDRLSTCPPFCEGHADPTSYSQHGTALEFFGTDGPVIVSQCDGEPPTVRLIELESPSHDFTPQQARLVALQMLQAADLAERYAEPSLTADTIRRLAELVAA